MSKKKRLDSMLTFFVFEDQLWWGMILHRWFQELIRLSQMTLCFLEDHSSFTVIPSSSQGGSENTCTALSALWSETGWGSAAPTCENSITSIIAHLSYESPGSLMQWRNWKEWMQKAWSIYLMRHPSSLLGITQINSLIVLILHVGGEKKNRLGV